MAPKLVPQVVPKVVPNLVENHRAIRSGTENWYRKDTIGDSKKVPKIITNVISKMVQIVIPKW